jgi:hypothetical protein
MTIRIRKIKASKPKGKAVMRTRSITTAPKPASRPKGR